MHTGMAQFKLLEFIPALSITKGNPDLQFMIELAVEALLQAFVDLWFHNPAKVLINRPNEKYLFAETWITPLQMFSNACSCYVTTRKF